jgi:hypothetical protein
MLARRYNALMARKKMTTYMEEDLLRSAKVLAARTDGTIYAVIEEALRRYLREIETDESQPSLADSLPGSRTRRSPGVPREEAARLSDGETLSEAVLAERESRDY